MESEEPVSQIRDLLASQRAARLPWDEARRITEVILRITVSLITAPSDLLPVQTEAQARWFARHVFVPLIEHGFPEPDSTAVDADS